MLCCKPVVKLRDCRNLLTSETTNRIQSLDQEQEANSVWCLGDRDVRSRRKFSGPLLKWKSRRGASCFSSFASSSFSSFSAQEIAQSWVEATTFFFWVSRPGNTSNGEMIVVISIDLEIRGKYYYQPKDNIERSSRGGAEGHLSILTSSLQYWRSLWCLFPYWHFVSFSEWMQWMKERKVCIFFGGEPIFALHLRNS